MATVKGLRARLRALFRRGAAERELDEELRFHIEMETEQNLRSGMPPAEARRRALRDFGGVQPTKEAHRDVRGRWLEELIADTRYALRTLRRAPVLAGAAIITLALGIGANTTIFSAVNAEILKPLPFASPGRLVMLWEENPEKGWHEQLCAPANAFDWKDQVRAFADVALYFQGAGQATLTGEGTPQILKAAGVSGNFFDLLGVRVQLGRALTADETWSASGVAHTAVISDRFWRERFGADGHVIGRSIRIDGQPTEIVGVAPAGFALPVEGVDIWQPMAWKPELRRKIFFRRAHFVRAIARLAPGASFETADAQLQTVASRLKLQYPETNKYMGAGLTPLHRFLVGDTQLPLLVLLASVALLLLIACANVGNLLLVRAAGREREAALRLTLGAGRRRLAKQALTESLVLSALGGVAGVALGVVGIRVLEALLPGGMLRSSHFAVDWTVLGYVVLIVLGSGILFGTAPALWMGRRSPAESLKEGGRGGDSRRMRRWTELLVVGEVALAVVLTLGAGLLVRSFRELISVDPGFDPRGVLAMQIALSGPKYDSASQQRLFFEQLVERVKALPGVEGAAVTTVPPLAGTGYTSDFAIAGRPAGEYYTEITHRSVMTDYFHVMHVRLLRGRIFTAADRQGAPHVLIINEQVAQKYFKGQDPVGQRITFDKIPNDSSEWSTIVGVVAGERQRDLSSEPLIEAYIPYAQEIQSAVSLLSRTNGDPSGLAPAIRRILGEMDHNVAVADVRSMEMIRAASLARERFLMAMLVVFAGVGLLLAVVGVYGVLAQVARRRTREMGIRIALGSPIGQVRWLVVRHGLGLVTVGVVIGISAALVATRGLGALLYHVAPADPVTFVTIPMLLAITGVAAAWVPAIQASRADPAVALRSE
ncbi:MAG TPA: ABC transporter permease [Gemmatimonadaceae bacterium]|jgi:putative ABC transport system permease protein